MGKQSPAVQRGAAGAAVHQDFRESQPSRNYFVDPLAEQTDPPAEQTSQFL